MTNLPQVESDTRGKSNAELHLLYLRKAQQAEERANARQRAIRGAVERDLRIKFNMQDRFWKGRDFTGEVDFATSKACSADPAWKKQVSLNQWYIAQATMYGTAANNELLQRIVKVLESRG